MVFASAPGGSSPSFRGHVFRAAAGLAVGMTAAFAGAVAAQDSYGPPVPVELQSAPRLEPPQAVPDALGTIAWEAVRTYPSVSAAEASIRASEADVSAAKWLRFPSVSVGARLGSDELGNLSPQLQVEQPIWSGGRITGSIERAEALQEASEARLGETIQDLALQALNAYYGAVSAARREASTPVRSPPVAPRRPSSPARQ